MNLSEIKAGLNQKGYIYRSEFMRNYEFDGVHMQYLAKYICNNIKTSNIMFLTDLIYLSIKIEFTSLKFRNILKEILMKDGRSLVKLAILDYFVELDSGKLPKDYEEMLLKLLKKKNYRIVQTQIYFNLFLLNNSFIRTYFDGLAESVKKTRDWKSIYRVLLNFKYVSSMQFVAYKIDLLKLIDKLNYEKKFGEGVDQMLTIANETLPSGAGRSMS